ncbi:MAG TPA: hypothetical protein VEN82_01290, partial [Actinomycetota bacterium]|nr:hypothetical protein [Actinomycetota bacterium]
KPTAPAPWKSDPPPLLAGAVHGDGTLTYVGGSTRTFSGDFGLITSVGDGSITVHRRDGKDATAPTTDATCVRLNGRPASLADVKPGQPALVLQENGSSVVVRAGRQVLGGVTCGLFDGVVHGDSTLLYADGSTRLFSYDRGRIASVGGTLALIRRDCAKVAFSTDGSTRVQIDCEPASVEDLKTGEAAGVISEAGHADLIRAFTAGMR